MASVSLGRTLRQWRDRVDPAETGFAAGGRRRAPGLRREELALLAGVSVDYLVRLEQGRATSPSRPVVEALARALRLSDDERAHLFRLAGLEPTPPGVVPVRITPGVRRALDRLAGTAVAVYDASWTLVEATPLYAALMGEPAPVGHPARNAAWRVFVGGVEGAVDRVRHTPESTAARQASLAGDLRRASALFPRDHQLSALVDELRARSDRFRELWDAGVLDEHVGGSKVVDHPQVGAIRVDCDILTVAGADMHLMLYTAEPGTEDADKLDLVGVLGQQDLAPAD